MPVYGLNPLAVKDFGGLNTLLDPTQLPPNLSPDCQDVQFVPGSVLTRPGLSLIQTITGKINGLKNFVLPDLSDILLAFNSSNQLYGDGVLIRTLGQYTDSRSNSITAFGREYIAVSDGKIGVLPPLAYDGANLDRVSPDGPYGRGASAGTFTLADSASAGNISAGNHSAVVMFVFRSGYISRPIPIDLTPLLAPNFWTAAGGKSVDCTNIPAGPAGCVGRIIAFTAAGGASYFYLPGTSMDIRDNTTTSVTLDFTDTDLLAGINVDDLFRNITLPPAAGVVLYAQRLFWWGLLNTIAYETSNTINALGSPTSIHYPILPNSSFDGDWALSGGVPYPAPSWVATANVAGLSKETSDTLDGTGFAVRITGDGATAIRGQIIDATYGEYWSPAKSYKVSAWVKRSSGLVAGTFRIFQNLAATPGLAVTAAQASTSWQRFEATLRTTTDAITVSQINLQVDGTPTNNEYFLIDDIRIYPSDLPFLSSQVAASRPEEPDRYDGVDGFMTVAENNGQAVRSAFVLRDFLYLVKEHSLYVTQDDGVSEPDNWPIREVSARVGTPSVRGVGLGDEWAVIAGHEGVFYFDGGPPVKISQEIQPTWDQINWAYEHLLEVKVDTKNKRVYISIPYGSATQADRQLVLDYKNGFGDGQRKWCPWIIPNNSMTIIAPSGSSHELYIGSNDNSGKIWKLDSNSASDDGAAINSYWQSGYFSQSERMLFGYLSAQITGTGVTTPIRLFRGGQSDYRDVRGWSLVSDGNTNRERQIHSVRERLAVRVGTNFASHKFELTGLNVFVQPAPWSPIRGHNR